MDTPTKLSELSIRNDERAESSETFQSLIAMLFGSVLVDWCIWESCIPSLNLLRLPDEILEEVALVLGEEKVFGLLDYIAEIGDQCLALGGELLGWVSHWLRLEEAVECDIDLLVL
jgi:hypothetical protein